MAAPKVEEEVSLVVDHDLSLAARQQRGRIWIDGCFDFVHHGHAGAMLQARQLGTELYVGVHSDEAITLNKAPPVMDLDERIAAVDACRWATQSVPGAPYVTDLAFIDNYHTRYVVHGDDITADADGNDCYRFCKEAGRFLVVRRTPGISTTDLVGRMLVQHSLEEYVELQSYHVRSVTAVLEGTEACVSGSGPELHARIKAYATDASGLAPGVPVLHYNGGKSWDVLASGPAALPGQRIVYVDGGWDLFCSGHIAFLQAVREAEIERARKEGWFSDEKRQQRQAAHGEDYSPVYLMAGVHSDADVHRLKGGAYPIMSIFERGLCVLQCRHISALILSTPRHLSRDFLSSLTSHAQPATPSETSPDAVYHGPTSATTHLHAYKEAQALGIFHQIRDHLWQNVRADTIVARILSSRARYEERQRIKGAKNLGEQEIRNREALKGI